jgi:molybdopterin converting factor small subunit
MMIIKIKIFSFLRQYVPFSHRRLDGDKWDIPEGANVARALTMLNMPEKQDKIFLVNGRSADGETVLHEGDVLLVFPPINGG